MTHGSIAASCRTATACPAIVRVPVRSLGFAFAVTLTVTVPDPVPPAPLLIVIHPRSDAAVHARPAAVVTPTKTLPPETSNESEDWESENVHVAGGVGWVDDFSAHAQTAAIAAPTVRATATMRPK